VVGKPKAMPKSLSSIYFSSLEKKREKGFT